MCFRVNDTYIVKVGDFGLSRDIYVKDYYREGDRGKPKPFRWMALESLRQATYTSQSDVVREKFSESIV